MKIRDQSIKTLQQEITVSPFSVSLFYFVQIKTELQRRGKEAKEFVTPT